MNDVIEGSLKLYLNNICNWIMLKYTLSSIKKAYIYYFFKCTNLNLKIGYFNLKT